MELPTHIRRAIERLRASTSVLLVTHHDADGASSAGVLYRALDALGKDVEVLVLRQFYPETLEDLPEGYDYVVFTDLAGRYTAYLPENSLVIDHHDNSDLGSPRLFHPAQMGYDPDRDASASTLSALVAFHLHRDPKLLPLGLVGAAGDNQVERDFSGLNRVFVVRSLKEGVLTLYKDLVLPAIHIKELYWALLHAEPPLPGLTGNEEGVYRFFELLGIEGRSLYYELSMDERRRFFTGLFFHLLRMGWPWDRIKALIGEVYEINGNVGWTQRVRTFKSFLNALAKKQRTDLFLPLFLDDYSLLPEAERVFYQYKGEILDAIQEGFARAESWGPFYLVDLRDKPPYVSGTVAAVLAAHFHSPVVVLVEEGDYVKASIRGGRGLSAIVARLGVEGGGHDEAAGFRVPREKLEDTLNRLLEEFKAEG